MKKRTWLRLARKLHKTFNPVNLGQTRGGLFAAAVIIAGWQLSAPVRADIASGSSSNEYFRLEWSYDTYDGTGWTRLDLVDDYGWGNMIMEDVRFTTAGTPFESLTYGWQHLDVFGPPTLVGHEGGLPLYEYEALGPFVFPCFEAYPIEIDIRFDPENAELRVTELRNDTYWASSSGGIGIPVPASPLPFVTIQTIPEPAAVATMALAAAALAATRRRDD
jgi:hypothetical protein